MAVVRGTTPSDYNTSDPALTWDLRLLDVDKVAILIANTGSSSLDFVVQSKLDINGTLETEISDRVDGGNSIMIYIETPKKYLVVNVKSSDPLSPTTFEIQTAFTSKVKE